MVVRRAAQQDPRRVLERIPDHDVAVGAVDEPAVFGGTERCWDVWCSSADVDRQHHGQEGRQDGKHDKLPPRRAGRRDPRRCELHGKPPFEGGPGGPLPRGCGPPEDVRQVVGRVWRRKVCQRRGQMPLEGIDRGHAGRPSGTACLSATASPSMVARSTPIERCSRDLAVPSGMPTAAATSGSGIPRK